MISWIIYEVVVVIVLLYCKYGKEEGHVPDPRKPLAFFGLSIYTIVMLIVLVVTVCSCGSSRSSSKQETSIESNTGSQRKDTASLVEQSKKTETEDVAEEVEEETTVYDTSKPTDPATGRPPVLSDTKKTTKKGTNKNKTEDSSKVLNQSSAEEAKNDTTIKDVREEDKKRDETTVPKQIGGIVWALVALVGLIIVGWLVYKKRNK